MEKNSYILPMIKPPPPPIKNIPYRHICSRYQKHHPFKVHIIFFLHIKSLISRFFHIIKLTVTRYRIEIMLAPSTTAIDNNTQIYICQRSERPLHPLTINTDMLLNSHASLGPEIHQDLLL